MADNKAGRDKQADNEARRQRERDVEIELERGDEPEPPVEDGVLDDIETDLEAVSFPATGADVVEAIGDCEVDSAEGTYTVAELVPDTDAETFEAPTDIRVRVQRLGV